MTRRRPAEVMPRYGLPPTLLPANVVSAAFDDLTGAFEVRLERRVVRSVDRYQVRYKEVVKGVLSAGCVARLSGVSVKKGLWIPVSRIEANGEVLRFHVGPVVKRLPASAFDAP